MPRGTPAGDGLPRGCAHKRGAEAPQPRCEPQTKAWCWTSTREPANFINLIPGWTETSCSTLFIGRIGSVYPRSEDGRSGLVVGGGTGARGSRAWCVFFIFRDGGHVTRATIAQVALQCASARLDGPHKMSLMLTWLWRPPGLEGTKGRGILRPPARPRLHSSSRSWARHK